MFEPITKLSPSLVSCQILSHTPNNWAPFCLLRTQHSLLSSFWIYVSLQWSLKLPALCGKTKKHFVILNPGSLTLRGISDLPWSDWWHAAEGILWSSQLGLRGCDSRCACSVNLLPSTEQFRVSLPAAEAPILWAEWPQQRFPQHLAVSTADNICTNDPSQDPKIPSATLAQTAPPLGLSRAVVLNH